MNMFTTVEIKMFVELLTTKLHNMLVKRKTKHLLQ